MSYINYNPLNTPYPYNPPAAPPPPYPIPIVPPSQPWVGPPSPPKGPYGKLGNDGYLINYVGLQTDTAEVIVDNCNRTIRVNANLDKLRENVVIEQNTEAPVWNIKHNLDRYPIVTVVDYNWVVCLAEIQYIDKNNIQVRFSEPRAGRVILS